MAQPLSRMERRKQETRREILDAAFDCFAERGYHATSISHIVTKVGVAQGTFYQYFQSKRDILDQVLDDLIARLTDALAAIPPQEPASLGDYRRQAERITDTLTEVFTADLRAIRLLLLQAAAVDEEMARRVLSFHTLATALQAAYLQHGVDAGYFRPDLDVDSAARAVNGMLFAAATYRLTDPSPDDYDRLTATIREIVYRSLAADNPASTH
ncbi:TetR/AcrR family transcriptional regulator [Nocardia sp. NPDC051832]|uniref:TetR/AcrR family transcriptional regulator n=1 Tax=Nocardia sp. NPDC051832 TaxID=3155673 RepID=UPI003416CC39